MGHSCMEQILMNISELYVQLVHALGSILCFIRCTVNLLFSQVASID